jgi:hypothetical protein
VSDEDDQLAWRNVWRVVQLLEGPTLAFVVQQQQVTHSLQVFLCRQVIVHIQVAFKFLLLLLQDWCLAGGREWRRGAL